MVVAEHNNRQTGTLIQIIDNREGQFDDGAQDFECRWFTACDDHGLFVGHPTRALAQHHAADPIGWCEECRFMKLGA